MSNDDVFSSDIELHLVKRDTVVKLRLRMTASPVLGLGGSVRISLGGLGWNAAKKAAKRNRFAAFLPLLPGQDRGGVSRYLLLAVDRRSDASAGAADRLQLVNVRKLASAPNRPSRCFRVGHAITGPRHRHCFISRSVWPNVRAGFRVAATGINDVPVRIQRRCLDLVTLAADRPPTGLRIEERGRRFGRRMNRWVRVKLAIPSIVGTQELRLTDHRRRIAE